MSAAEVSVRHHNIHIILHRPIKSGYKGRSISAARTSTRGNTEQPCVLYTYGHRQSYRDALRGQSSKTSANKQAFSETCNARQTLMLRGGSVQWAAMEPGREAHHLLRLDVRLTMPCIST